MSRRTTAYLLMLLVSAIWGAAPAVIKFTLADFPPLIFLTYRFFISSIIAVSYLALTGQKLPKKPAQWSRIIWHSILGFTIALGLLFYGFDKTTALAGNILTALGPMVTVVLAAVFLRERVTKSERTGILIALAGTLFIVFSPFLNGGIGNMLGALEGNALIIAALFADATAVILAKLSERSKVGAVVLAQLSFIIAFLTILPVALAVHGTQAIITTMLRAPLHAHLGVWFMAVVSGTIAYSLRNRAIRSIEVSETAPFHYLYPIWGAPLSLFWLKEHITAIQIAGSLIIAAGVLVAEHKKKR